MHGKKEVDLDMVLRMQTNRGKDFTRLELRDDT